MKFHTVLLAAGLTLLAPAVALADPRLDEKVYSPFVDKGEVELESRAGSEIGGPLGGAATTVFEAEYGLSDRLSLALVAGWRAVPPVR